MATTIRRKPARRASVTRHPLFPLLVALWFAALFTLSSFAIRLSLLERWVTESGVDALIPAAAPPLGLTARLGFALLWLAVGGAVGAVVGRKLAAGAPSARRPRERSATAPEWPAIALEDAGAARFDDDARLPADGEGEPAFDVAAEALAPEPLRAPPGEPTAAQRIATADLDDLSHVELIERLAIALERRRGRGPLSKGETEVLGRSYDALREFLRPEPDATLAPAIIDQPSPTVHDLSARRAAHHGAHTASAGLDPEATERALQDALASLQRMSRGR